MRALAPIRPSVVGHHAADVLVGGLFAGQPPEESIRQLDQLLRKLGWRGPVLLSVCIGVAKLNQECNGLRGTEVSSSAAIHVDQDGTDPPTGQIRSVGRHGLAGEVTTRRRGYDPGGGDRDPRATAIAPRRKVTFNARSSRTCPLWRVCGMIEG